MKHHFLEDGSGDLSSMRLALVFALIMAAILSFVIVFRGVSWEGVALVGAWLAPAFGFKSVQSFAEHKKGRQE